MRGAGDEDSSEVRFTIPFWSAVSPHSKYLPWFPGLDRENIPQISLEPGPWHQSTAQR